MIKTERVKASKLGRVNRKPECAEVNSITSRNTIGTDQVRRKQVPSCLSNGRTEKLATGWKLRCVVANKIVFRFVMTISSLLSHMYEGETLMKIMCDSNENIMSYYTMNRNFITNDMNPDLITVLKILISAPALPSLMSHLWRSASNEDNAWQ